ncbi:universal stress protein [Kocuria sp. M1R5S2]|uniref:universal stress protein n=1 Tax=Kocuria rhizosphaerae TaxID=3376285 RepID=UPI0037934B1E
MVAAASQRIVVGVDGSDSSLEALREGARVAGTLGAPLAAVMFWEGPPVYEGWGTVDPAVPPAGTEERLRSAIAGAFGNEVPEGLSAELVHGRAAARLVEESERALMLVLGRGGRGGVRGGSLGSVSGACVAHARCPVLVVRH